MNDGFKLNSIEKEVIISIDHLTLNGILALPGSQTHGPETQSLSPLKGIILFAHGSGSGRFSPRNNYVARELQKAHFGTLLMDLLSEEEETIENRRNVFDIELLSNRLNLAKKWVIQELTPKNSENRDIRENRVINSKNKNIEAIEADDLKIGFFGASTGAGAAIEAAAKDPAHIFAVVSRGGRPDLAVEGLSKILAPTLLIVGGADGIVIDLNQAAFNKMNCEKKLEIIPGATHLFEEPGALEKVAELAVRWFLEWGK